MCIIAIIFRWHLLTKRCKVAALKFYELYILHMDLLITNFCIIPLFNYYPLTNLMDSLKH